MNIKTKGKFNVARLSLPIDHSKNKEYKKSFGIIFNNTCVKMFFPFYRFIDYGDIVAFFDKELDFISWIYVSDFHLIKTKVPIYNADLSNLDLKFLLKNI